MVDEIEGEARRWALWAVDGSPLRVGHYTSHGVLAIPQAERAELLARISERLIESPRAVDEWEARFRGAARALIVRRRVLRQGTIDSAALDRVLDSAARVLSVDVLAQKLAPDDARALLVRFVPERVLSAHLGALYQPLCTPRVVRGEAALLFVASRFVRARTTSRRSQIVCEAAGRAQETTTTVAMRARLARVIDAHGPAWKSLRAARARVLAADAARRDDAQRAARAIKRALGDIGEPTPRARATLAGIVRAIQFVATWNELARILVMDAARDVRGVLDRSELRGALRKRALRSKRR